MSDYMSGTDAYQLASKSMKHELANKYAEYYTKKTRQIKSNRLQNSYVDSGRNKVYQSEFATERKFPDCRESMTEKEITKYYKRIVKSKTYQSLITSGGQSNPPLRIMKQVKYNVRVAGQASYRGVALQPSCGMNKWVVLHELAHTAGYMHHDVGFRQTLVKLISRFLGTEVAKELKRQFRSRKIKMTVSQIIQSPEKWLESYQKMAAMRDKNHLIKEMKK